MKTLVIVTAHRTAQETIQLLAPHYSKCGCDLVGVDDMESPVECWPGCFKAVVSIKAGWPMAHANRLTETVRMALDSQYDRFVITEYDSLFTSQVQMTPEESFGACITGESHPDAETGPLPLLGAPLVATRQVWAKWLRAADSLIAAKKFGNWSAEFFVAMACHRCILPIYNLGGAHHLNGTHFASDLVIARERVKDGAWHVHGIKRRDHLIFVLNQSDAFPQDAIMR